MRLPDEHWGHVYVEEEKGAPQSQQGPDFTQAEATQAEPSQVAFDMIEMSWECKIRKIIILKYLKPLIFHLPHAREQRPFARKT